MSAAMLTDLPGFAVPVADAQGCFRAVLDAMAHPGRIVQAGRTLQPPAPLCAAAAAVVLTLADAETPLALDGSLAAAGGWITFHCGAPLVPLEQARIAVLTQLQDFDTAQAGADEQPELGATLIVQVQTLGHGPAFLLNGPGLRIPERFQAAGLPAGFAALWHANHARFPRGIDLILCAGDQLAALPRSVRIREA